MRALIVGTCLWLSAAVSFAATPFDGQWTGQAGNENLTITLVTNEGKVTGRIALAGGDETPIESLLAGGPRI